MPTYEDYEQAQAEELHSELEQKFLKILSQPDAMIPSEEISEDGELDEEQRATLQSVLAAEMPTPAEIERDIKLAEHNAGIQRKRDEKQALKRVRRATRVKVKKRRRRR